jgi:putative ABC transport system permease protein
MIRHYLEVAYRHLLNQKLYSAINILGLAVGIASCLLIAMFVYHELSFDRAYANSDRIYRISRDSYPNGSPPRQMAANAPQVAPLMKLDFPEVEEAARIYCCGDSIVARDDLTFFESRVVQFADNEIFKIFDFDWQQGDAATALSEPYTMVLTESMARKYFGAEDPMGKTLLVENSLPARITGVIADLPGNTHLSFGMLLSLQTARAAFGDRFLENWGSNNFHTYVLLKDGASIETVQQRSAPFFERHLGEGGSKGTGFTAVPVADIHLRSNREFEPSPAGDLNGVYTFSAVAVLILMIACINFMNLATARAAQRAKEVGVRKAVGAERRQIVKQFLAESILVATIAVLIGAALVELALPTFAALLGKEIDLNYVTDHRALAMVAGLALSVGILAGGYPAFYLSAFRPSKVLRGDLTRGTAAASFRKILVIFQFSVSVVLMIATVVVYQQMTFARNVPLGFTKEQIVNLTGSPTGGLGSQWAAMKDRLEAHPEIQAVTASNITPGTRNTSTTRVRAEGTDTDGTDLAYVYVDYDFFGTYEIDVLAGRAFSRDFSADQLVPPDGKGGPTGGGFIINERAARQFGWTPESAVGKWFETFGARGAVVGVVADVYFESVHNPVQPMVFVVPPERMGGFPALRQASIRVTGSRLNETLAFIDELWSQYLPDQPIRRRFLSADFEALYQNESRQAQLFGLFSVLALVVGAMGLFGLTSFATTRRQKEIGIRKILGGTNWGIVQLLTTEFSILVLIANVVAWPIAYLVMQRWLTGFAYRVDLSVWVFVACAGVAVAIAWLTTAFVAANAARSNLIQALRSE